MFRKLRYVIEAVFLVIGLAFFRVLPLDIASAVGGVLGRMVGPLSRAHRTAEKNIEAALPELNQRQRNRILSEMWDNIGRVIGEYPHLSRPIMMRRITFEGLEHLQEVAVSGKSAFFVSGHFANWEIAPLTASLYGLPLVLIYRAANNPVADKVICHIRSKFNRAMYGKGRDGASNIIKSIKAGKPIGMLIDQKMNEGEAIEFFGREAMTGTAATNMAIKLHIPLLVARVIRTDGAYFHVSLKPPIVYDKHEDAAEAMKNLHQLFEEWIREYPSQWFWVHKRWGETD